MTQAFPAGKDGRGRSALQRGRQALVRGGCVAVEAQSRGYGRFGRRLVWPTFATSALRERQARRQPAAEPSCWVVSQPAISARRYRIWVMGTGSLARQPKRSARGTSSRDSASTTVFVGSPEAAATSQTVIRSGLSQTPEACAARSDSLRLHGKGEIALRNPKLKRSMDVGQGVRYAEMSEARLANASSLLARVALIRRLSMGRFIDF
jgi:hypothetical protein